MVIEILDENFKKLDILRKYTFAQYKTMGRDIGVFKVDAVLTEDLLPLLDKNKQFYFLFNYKTVGKIENISKKGDNFMASFSGRTNNLIFLKRVVTSTINFSGFTYEFVRDLITEELLKNPKSDRYMNIQIQVENEAYLKTVCSRINKQVTGGYIWDAIQPVLEQDNLCIFLDPVVKTIHLNDENKETNISQWILRISQGIDRTKGNSAGNNAVMFSQALSDITEAQYNLDKKDYCNVAYVAGEGEGKDRKWYEVYNKENVARADIHKKGWQREELWIDARDIQSTTDTGEILTPEQYQNLIYARANEKFVQARKKESYEATLTKQKRYRFGIDFDIGDFVTIFDQELQLQINAQTIGMVVSAQGSQEFKDPIFSYEVKTKTPMEEIKNTQANIERCQNDIKYLEHTIQALSTGEMKISKGSDYLVIKWENGLMLLAQQLTPNMVLNTSWKELYYGTVDLGKWKEPFKEIPWVLNVFAYSTAEVNYLDVVTKATATDIGKYDFGSHSIIDNKPINVYAIGLGFWK